MVTAIVYFDASDPEGFVDALGQTGPMFEEVAGFNGFTLKRGVEDPDRFLLTVEWNSVDDHTEWQKQNVNQFLERLDPFINGKPDIKHFA